MRLWLVANQSLSTKFIPGVSWTVTKEKKPFSYDTEYKLAVVVVDQSLLDSTNVFLKNFEVRPRYDDGFPSRKPWYATASMQVKNCEINLSGRFGCLDCFAVFEIAFQDIIVSDKSLDACGK